MECRHAHGVLGIHHIIVHSIVMIMLEKYMDNRPKIVYSVVVVRKHEMMKKKSRQCQDDEDVLAVLPLDNDDKVAVLQLFLCPSALISAEARKGMTYSTALGRSIRVRVKQPAAAPYILQLTMN